MSTDFLLFQRFISREAAQEVVALLAANGLEGRLVDEVAITDGLTTFQQNPAAMVLLRGPDFGLARDLLRLALEPQAAMVANDHYLFEFTDTELWQVLAKPDEWGALDVALAQRILRERGQEMPVGAVAELAAIRARALAEPRTVTAGQLVLGYASVLLGGLLGVFFGLYLMTSLTTLPDGGRVPTYSAASRWHGRVLVILGAVVFALVFLKVLFG